MRICFALPPRITPEPSVKFVTGATPDGPSGRMNDVHVMAGGQNAPGVQGGEGWFRRKVAVHVIGAEGIESIIVPGTGQAGSPLQPTKIEPLPGTADSSNDVPEA